MAITAKEIAQLAGVSRGTVDRALKGRPGVSEKTKARILEIAKQHAYKPNIIGKALVYSGKPIKVCVILNSSGNPFFDDVKAGIFAAQEDFASYGFEITLSEWKGYQADDLLRLLEALPEDISQLVLTPICNPRVAAKIRALQARGVNVVMLSSELEGIENAIYVGCDYLKSGRIAGRLTGLFSNGSARLYIMTGSSQHKGHAQRVEGIRAVLERTYPSIELIGISESNDDDSTAFHAMRAALKEHPEIDFVYITAAGVKGTLLALKEHSHTVKACAFDDVPVTRDALRSGEVLATICQQPFEQGYLAIKVLFEKIILKKDVKHPIYTDLSIKVDQSL